MVGRKVIVLVERSFCGRDADRHGGPGRGEGRGRGPVGCGSSLTHCGRHAGPQLPCPPHGEHASIGTRHTAPGPSSLAQCQPPCPAHSSTSTNRQFWHTRHLGRSALWTWSRNNVRPSAPPTRSAAQSRLAGGCQAIRACLGRRGPCRNGSPSRRGLAEYAGSISLFRVTPALGLGGLSVAPPLRQSRLDRRLRFTECCQAGLGSAGRWPADRYLAVAVG